MSEHTEVRVAPILCVVLVGCGFTATAVTPPPGQDAGIVAVVDADGTPTVPPPPPPPGSDPNDIDGDGVGLTDNCPTVPNADQRDGDRDGVGDACDSCPTVSNPARPTLGSLNPIQRDHDRDGRGDECDLCPHLASATDADTDSDGIGDSCDPQPTIKNPPAYFNGFYDPPDATWSSPQGAGATSDWVVERRSDGTLGWKQRVLDGSKRHQILLAGDHKEHFIDTVIVVEGISPADTTSGLRNAGATYGFLRSGGSNIYYACGVLRDEVNARDFIEGAVLQEDTLTVDKTVASPVTLLNKRIHVVGTAARTETLAATGTALVCAGGDPALRVTATLTGLPDGAIGLRTFGMSAWFDYLFYVETVPTL